MEEKPLKEHWSKHPLFVALVTLYYIREYQRRSVHYSGSEVPYNGRIGFSYRWLGSKCHFITYHRSNICNLSHHCYLLQRDKATRIYKVSA